MIREITFFKDDIKNMNQQALMCSAPAPLGKLYNDHKDCPMCGGRGVLSYTVDVELSSGERFRASKVTIIKNKYTFSDVCFVETLMCKGD